MSKELEESLEKIRNLKLIQVYESKPRLFFYNLYIGVARGLGTILGATVVLAVVLYVASHFQWIPVIGDVIKQLLNYVEDTKRINTIK